MKDIRSLINEKLKTISLALMKDEKKDSCWTSFSSVNMCILTIKKRTFCIAFTNEFDSLINNEGYKIATEKHSNLFGTGDVIDILRSLQISNNNFKALSFDRYLEYISNEKFAYVVEITNTNIGDKVLRLDLFRNVKPCKSDSSKHEFIGGLFHLFKHFSINNKTISKQKEIEFNVTYFDFIINKIIISFFFSELIAEKKDNKYYTLTRLDDEHKIKCSFYHNSIADVYFINTSHIIKSNKVHRL